ncbi:MAG: hypothetical protein A2X94_09860 [Bdellovibrionales bacterium GWB1_55_8]|nr:MAG: hypothetical protein A2X94_09860 [Bdellovibrionales bacterium GWB1_55_8]
MRRFTGSQKGALFAVLSIAIAGSIVVGIFRGGFGTSRLTKENVAKVIADSAVLYDFPTEVELPLGKRKKINGIIQYSFDPQLQEDMERLFHAYKPDYGAFVAMDAHTGRILSMVSYSHHSTQENLALRATFPSASVFKVVTAAAAIESGQFSANTVIAYNGSNHTLYRSNVLKTQLTRWTRRITLRDAFAKSVNTVFGKIGAFEIEPEDLREYADRFGFNRVIPADFPIQMGRAEIPDIEDRFGLAETASGFTRDNTMSPLQGALIASAIVNDGMMMEPYMVQAVYSPEGEKLYTADPQLSSMAVDPRTAAEIRSLMRETVSRGTSRGAFRKFFKGPFASLSVGGKTGSLTGTDPKGKYDWFVGYADSGKHKIAIAALTVHEKYWRVKSSYLARRAIESYFQETFANEAKERARFVHKNGRKTEVTRSL